MALGAFLEQLLRRSQNPGCLFCIRFYPAWPESGPDTLAFVTVSAAAAEDGRRGAGFLEVHA